MANKNNWLQQSPSIELKQGQNFIKHVALDIEGVKQLVNEIENPISTGHWFKKAEDWLSTIMVYPFSIRKIDNTKKLLNISVAKTNVPCYTITREGYGALYNMGEYYVKRYFNNFADFNGYTDIKVYLPYCGFVDIPTNEVMGKYMQFRLRIDLITGQGLYYIGVSDTSISHVDSLIVTGDEDKNTRIILTQSCQLGLQLPLASNNTLDVVRNLVNGSVRTAVGLGVTYAAVNSGTFQNVSNSSTVTTKKINKNKSTKIYSTRTKRTHTNTTKWSGGETDKVDRTSYSDNSNMAKYHANSQVIDSSLDSLSQFHIEGNCDKPTNASLLDSSTPNIKVVIKRPKIVEINDFYKHLYGVPLGVADLLGNYKGYTEATEVNIEGSMYGTANLYEKKMIETLLKEGVIL